MQRRSLLCTALALGSLGLAACGSDSSTEPNLPAQPSPAVPVLAAAAGSWVERTPPPHSQAALPATAAVTNASGQSTFHTIGGGLRASFFNPIRRVMAYNVATDLVTSTAAGVAFFRYNPATDGWARLPAPAHSGVGAVVKDKLYLAGNNDLAVYDPATNRWTAKAPPRPRLNVSAAPLGGKLYLIGEQIDPNGTSSRRITLAYDPASNSWSERTPPPVAFIESAASKVFLNGQPRIQVWGTLGTHNFQYLE